MAGILPYYPPITRVFFVAHGLRQNQALGCQAPTLFQKLDASKSPPKPSKVANHPFGPPQKKEETAHTVDIISMGGVGGLLPAIVEKLRGGAFFVPSFFVGEGFQLQ